MTQTIAQQIKWDFTNGDLIIRDKNGNLIYFENSKGFCAKYEYDSQGNQIYFEDSKGDWVKQEWDSHGEIYYEDSRGAIRDKRPKPCENKEIVIGGEKFKLVKV